MPNISLPAFHVTTRTKLTVEVHHELAQNLEHYRAFYKQAYAADVSDADLLREMARRFMEADREFQDYRNGGRSRSRSARQRPTVSGQAEGDGQ